MKASRTKMRRKNLHEALVLGVGCLALLAAALLWPFAPTAQAAAMALADDDILSDVSAQVGYAMVLEGGGSIGVVAYRGYWSTTARTGSLSYRNVTITGNLAGGRFSIGDLTSTTNRAMLDVGRSGTTTRMRLRFPNMFSPDRYVNIFANNAYWGFHNGTGAQYLNLGSLLLGQVYYNQAEIIMWADPTTYGADLPGPSGGRKAGGVRGLITLSAKIGLLEHRPNRAAGLTGFRFDNFVFSGSMNGSYTAPGNNPVGSALFGTETGTTPRPISIDVYTDYNVATMTRMRVMYTTTGFAWLQNTGLCNSDGSWRRQYGPVVLANWRPNPNYNTGTNPGHIQWTLPIRHGTFRWRGP
jgi:hypothetical protein